MSTRVGDVIERLSSAILDNDDSDGLVWDTDEDMKSDLRTILAALDESGSRLAESERKREALAVALDDAAKLAGRLSAEMRECAESLMCDTGKWSRPCIESDDEGDDCNPCSIARNLYRALDRESAALAANAGGAE